MIKGKNINSRQFITSLSSFLYSILFELAITSVSIYLYMFASHLRISTTWVQYSVVFFLLGSSRDTRQFFAWLPSFFSFFILFLPLVFALLPRVCTCLRGKRYHFPSVELLPDLSSFLFLCLSFSQPVVAHHIMCGFALLFDCLLCAHRLKPRASSHKKRLSIVLFLFCCFFLFRSCVQNKKKNQQSLSFFFPPSNEREKK